MDDQISAPGSPIYNDDVANNIQSTSSSASEGPLYTPEISFKSVRPQNLEAQGNPEVLPAPETITQLGGTTPQFQREKSQPDIQIQKLPSQPNIVDKSHEPLKIHEIKKPGDKLTEEADEEEERFIEEVEKHHGG